MPETKDMIISEVKINIFIPGENLASLLIVNSSLLSEQIRKGDSPFCRGASRT